ncbi:MAG: FtsW/RodA/SpoVE family cell cycle protein [Oscillospiraceae bacterium]|nr:FtsW/RodA/SpoVE family cell cycle protein [Oscillospiraceae bacterium]
MGKEKTKLNYFFVKLVIVITHTVLLGNIYLNGNLTDYTEAIKLTVLVLGSDLIYFSVIHLFAQDVYTLDLILVLILNISLIFQSSFGGIDFNLKHFITTAAAFISCQVGFLLTRNNFKAEQRQKYYYAGICVLMVVIILFTGSRSMWINFGGFSLQPSEFIKPLFVFACATSLYKQQNKKKLGFLYVTPNNIAMIAMTAAILGLQWWCRDLGSIPTFGAVFGCAVVNRLCYPRAKFSKKKIAALICMVLVFAFAAIKLAPGYVKDRLYVDIWADQYGNGYQQCRALIAIAEGGWFGKGPGSGSLCNVAAYDTDIVFSSVSEEWGMLAAILFVLLILLMLLMPVINPPRCYYHGTIAAGVTAVFVVQMSLNIFGSCNLIPFTGVTLPFLSNGGSSMVTSGFLLGMLKATQSPKFVRNIVVRQPANASERRKVN